MSGIAVYDALEELGLKPDIKWVNDVLAREKKICGILAETAETSKGLAIIVGIGVNITSSNFPDELAGIATSIKTEIGRSIKPDEMAEVLTRFISYFYDILRGENGPNEIRKEWQRRSSYFSGKSVRVVLENETITGVTDGLEPNGSLRVRTRDGTVLTVQAGDVQRLRATDNQ